MTKIDTNTAARIKERLDALPPRQPMRPYDLIAQLTDSVSGTLERGYDLDHLMSILEEEGIKLARNTIRNYLSRAKKDLARTGANGDAAASQTTASVPDVDVHARASKTSAPAVPTTTSTPHTAKRRRSTKQRAH